jgi:hypothetical protein
VAMILVRRSTWALGLASGYEDIATRVVTGGGGNVDGR